MVNHNFLKYDLISKKTPVILLIIFFIFNTYIFHKILFIDHDVIIYSIIGKAIYGFFDMPYTYIFDHKPIATYYIYGAIQYLLPIRGMYFTLSCFCVIVSFLLLAKIKIYKITLEITCYLLLFMMASLVVIDRFSGNTETVLMPMTALIIYFVYCKNKFRSFFIGLVISVSVNVNYLDFVILFPLVLSYIFFDRYSTFINKLLSMSLGFIVGLILLYLPFFISGASIISYFKDQYNFLSVYHDAEYKELFIKFILYFSLYSPIIYSYIKVKSVRSYDFVISISLLLGSLLSVLVSGRPYNHYFVNLILPFSFILIQVINSERFISVLNILFLFIISIAFSSAYLNKYNESGGFKYDEGLINRINDLSIHDKTALNINTSHVIYNYTNLRSISKYVFPNHVNMIEVDYNKYYLDMINKKPNIIITSIGLCPDYKLLCESINSAYYLDVETSHNGNFDLYIRK